MARWTNWSTEIEWKSDKIDIAQQQQRYFTEVGRNII